LFLEKVEPQARQLLTTFDLQGALIRRVFGTFWNVLETRADDLSALMQKHWKVTASLKDLPAKPRWMINATCYETGKNWRFERFRMGDYLFGYTSYTDVPLSDALAASAGFPDLIGALELPTAGRSWFCYHNDLDAFEQLAEVEKEERWSRAPVQPRYSSVHLWDGGVYDNQGLEGIHDFKTGWSRRFGFLIVSDAAGRAGEARYRKGYPAFMRIMTGIMMAQVRSLRARAILERVQNLDAVDHGIYLQMGNTADYILKSAGHADWQPKFASGSLTAAEVVKAASTPTAICRLSAPDYECLFHHGYDVADATLCAYYPQDFQHIPYVRRGG
jgi:NTE family protein